MPHGRPNPHGSFLEQGASDIYRDQGERLIAIKFDIHGRDLAGAVAEAKRKVKNLIKPPCRLEWSGEFQEMEEAESRLRIVIPLAAAAVIILLYMAFRSLVDVLLVFSNVVTMVCGGVWALALTNTNFSISAAVGFISIFGVAVMDALLQVSSFNRLRLMGKPMEEAIVEGSKRRLRPIMMTALTAIFGLLPAALSTRIGAQTAAAAGHRGDRRHARGLAAEPLPDAGALQRAPPPAALGRFGWPGRMSGKQGPSPRESRPLGWCQSCRNCRLFDFRAGQRYIFVVTMRMPRVLQYGLLVAVLGGAIAGGILCADDHRAAPFRPAVQPPGDEGAEVQLAGGQDAIRLPQEVAAKLGIQTKRVERRDGSRGA